MLVALAAAILLCAPCQAAAPDRRAAEQLARSGRTTQALVLFEQIIAADPADAEARQWVARLYLRSGRVADAEAEFRTVLLAHPSDLDARIGLGATLTRKGAWQEALDVLRSAEAEAGENGD